jgi:tetratricopeptide (TPR) repeat protein
MHRSSLFLTAALIGTTIALVQPMAQAKSPVEVGRIAKAITVEIKQVGSEREGSGILLQKQGTVYTVLTAEHVVKSGDSFTIKTSDGQVHKAIADSVRPSGNNIDLAVLKFRSINNYTVVEIGTSNSLEELSPIYVAGFPKSTYAIASGTINISDGKVISKANKGNNGGYSLIYNNITYKGMSGGPVLNEAGELVAIHGQGDRDGKEGDGEKTGRNLGIVVERFGTVASAMGVQLEQRVAVLPKSQGLNASDYFLRANGKYDDGNYSGALADYNQSISLNPKYFGAYNNRAALKHIKLNDIQGALADYNQSILVNPKNAYVYKNRAALKRIKLNDIQGALADYNQAISLNPKYSEAYYNRAILKRDKLNDRQGELVDYNQAISLNPINDSAYYNRAILKDTKLDDIQGALADYNQAISLNPKNASAYNNRGVLKINKLNDIQGGLADYNQAISLNPKNASAYVNRGVLKNNKLSDRTGAIQDFRKAARLFREQGNTRNLQKALSALQQIGATE